MYKRSVNIFRSVRFFSTKKTHTQREKKEELGERTYKFHHKKQCRSKIKGPHMIVQVFRFGR